jgi:hypothetical protein
VRWQVFGVIPAQAGTHKKLKSQKQIPNAITLERQNTFWGGKWFFKDC